MLVVDVLVVDVLVVDMLVVVLICVEVVRSVKKVTGVREAV